MDKEDIPFINTAWLDSIAPLLQKLLAGESLAETELALLEEWKGQSAANKALLERLASPAALQEMLQSWHAIEKNREINKQRGISRVHELVNPAVRPVHFLQRRLIRYAAAIFLLLGAGTYFWATHKNTSSQLADKAVIIAPGRDGAILTLADGSKVVLDSMGNGLVANQQGVKVSLQNGQLAYGPTSTATTEVAYNTVSTPKGRQFRLVLPDGSKIWLNAASAIRYPTTFTGNERRVKLEGEAYFEIATNAAMPFKVIAGDATEVEVLGTSFNINAYKNEQVISTTLLEGAVRINAYQQSQILKPGQQAAVKPATEQLQVYQNADLDKVMAWKNGLFNFEDATLPEVMRQLERWYDIEVTYTKDIPPIRFGGEINKQNTLQDVLQILEKSNVHFRLEQGRKLVVMP